MVKPSCFLLLSRRANANKPESWINYQCSTTDDKLWQLIPNTHDIACKLHPSTLVTSSNNVCFFANFTFEHEFFNFPNSIQQYFIKSCYVLASWKHGWYLDKDGTMISCPKTYPRIVWHVQTIVHGSNFVAMDWTIVPTFLWIPLTKILTPSRSNSNWERRLLLIHFQPWFLFSIFVGKV